MIKKTLCFMTLLLGALQMWALSGNDWYKYPIFKESIDDIVETSTKTFYLSGGNLYSFNASDNELYAYNHLNALNDEEIKSLYYNADKKYLVVVYENSNMDVILDNGKIINMPDIKDASVASSKTINDMAFGNDCILVGTDFGIVLFNDDRFEVIESGIYNKSIKNVGIMGDNLLIYGAADTQYQIRWSPMNIRHNTIDKFNLFFNFAISQLYPLGPNLVAFRANNSNDLYIRRYNFETGQYQNVVTAAYSYDYPFKEFKDGVFTITADKILIIDGEQINTYDIPVALQGQKLAFYDAPDKIWCGDADGIGRYDINGSTPTVLYDKMLYDGAITANRIGFMKWSPDNRRLYISNRECSVHFTYARGERSPYYQTTNIIDGMSVIDASLKDATAVQYDPRKLQEQNGNKRMYGDPMDIIEDPENPDRYYCANYYEGIYVIERNAQTGEYEQIGVYNCENTPIPDIRGPRTMYIDFDKKGNMWVGHQFGSSFSVLPADKRRKHPSEITAADWLSHPHLEKLEFYQKDFLAVLCRHSDMIFFTTALYEKGFVAIDTKGTYDNLNDDTVYVWNKLTDQDGKELNFAYVTSFLEDNRGCVWVGTTQGVFELTNPSDATNPNMRVRRIKVPRNDGTNYADYLLDSDKVMWMCQDPSGRKWIATESSGIYLVSETGEKIIYHFDTTNSPLMSNMVTTIECDKHDNTVYVGTTYGLYSFKGDSSPGKEDFTEIYAYPNPVRPEYSGMVTITGLMDHSIVKITDSMGNAVYQTRSEGGMASWDVSSGSGDRVKSGVYYVYVSSTDGSTTTGAVTKILVIN